MRPANQQRLAGGLLARSHQRSVGLFHPPEIQQPGAVGRIPDGRGLQVLQSSAYESFNHSYSASKLRLLSPGAHRCMEPHLACAPPRPTNPEISVPALLKLALICDGLTAQLGRLAAWAVLLAAMISAGNAFVRYSLGISSNGWLEIQWYFFAATVMLGAPHVLKLNEHVRVDIVYGRLKGNGPVYVDLFGLVFFLLPVMAVLAYLSWPLFLGMYVSGEMSPNTGGLVRWPFLLLLPLGFGLMVLQGLAEIVKRICYLQGHFKMDLHYEKPLQ